MIPPALNDAKTQAPTTAEETAPRQGPDAQPWREIAAQAAVETDPDRLSRLVDELIRLLDEERRAKNPLTE